MFCLFNYIFLKELKVVEVLINQCREKQILQGILSTWTEKNRVEVQRWRCSGGGWEGGTFQNAIPRKLGHVFFRSNLRLEEESRFLFDTAAS